MKLSQDERRIYQFANNHDQTQYDQIETLLQRIGGDTFKITMKLLTENKLQSKHGVFNLLLLMWMLRNPERLPQIIQVWELCLKHSEYDKRKQIALQIARLQASEISQLSSNDISKLKSIVIYLNIAELDKQTLHFLENHSLNDLISMPE